MFKGQVWILKVVQLWAPWTKISKFFFSDFLKVGSFCQATKKVDSCSITATAGAETWNKKSGFVESVKHSFEIFCCQFFSSWKFIGFLKISSHLGGTMALIKLENDPYFFIFYQKLSLFFMEASFLFFIFVLIKFVAAIFVSVCQQ